MTSRHSAQPAHLSFQWHLASHDASFDVHQNLHSPEGVVTGGAVELVELELAADVLETFGVLVATFVGCMVIDDAVLALVLVAIGAT